MNDETYLVEIRGKCGFSGVLSTDSLEFARMLSTMILESDHDCTTEIRIFSSKGQE